MKGLHFYLFTFTSAVTYSVVVYLQIPTRQSWATASLRCFFFLSFFQSREGIYVFVLSSDTGKLSSLTAAVWMLVKQQ